LLLIPLVFNGVVVYFQGYNDSGDRTSLELKNAVLQNGAKVTLWLGKTTTTHVICRQLSSSHIDLLQKGSSFIHVVNLDWLSDSIKAGKRLSEGKYLVLQPKHGVRIDEFLKQSETHKNQEESSNNNNEITNWKNNENETNVILNSTNSTTRTTTTSMTLDSSKSIPYISETVSNVPITSSSSAIQYEEIIKKRKKKLKFDPTKTKIPKTLLQSLPAAHDLFNKKS
jgi:hypothetical protein